MVEKIKSWANFQAGMWPALIALACGLIFTAFSWDISRQHLHHQLELEFESEVKQIRTNLQTNIAGYTQTLRAASALFGTKDIVTREDWRLFIASLKLEQNYRAIQAVAFARLVDDSELDALIGEVRKSGISDFAVRPSGQRDQYAVNVFSEPRTELNVKALGYDMWQDDERRATMQRARDTDAPTITRKLTLKVDEESAPVPAFIMYQPVKRRTDGKLIGYVLSPFRMPVLMEQVLKSQAPVISLSIYDGDDGRPETLYFGDGPAKQPADARFVLREPIMVGGRRWTLMFTSLPRLDDLRDTGHSTHMLVGGLVGSLLLFVTVGTMAGTRKRALRLARNMTSSLRDSEERFRVLVELAPDAIVVYDAESARFIDSNAQAIRLFGCDREELLNGDPARFYPDGQLIGAANGQSIHEMFKHGLDGEHALFERVIANAKGDLLHCEVRLAMLPAAGRCLIRGSFIDISERKRAEDEIRNLAFYDPLTHLPNRRMMFDRLRRALVGSARRNRHGALMLFDLDDFKSLNDTLGHDVGDQFLIEVASRMESCIREGDTVARLGGDEFVVILDDLDAEAVAAMQAEIVAVKIQSALSEPYRLNVGFESSEKHARNYQCTSSIGITLFRDQSLSVDELMKRADTAMYQAKAAGRNTLRFFDLDMQAVVSTRAEFVSELKVALRESQFQLLYQPQVDGNARVTGAEALLHWQHPRRGLLLPGEFIHEVEDSGLILSLGHWFLNMACRQLAEWAKHTETAHLKLALNVGARQFYHKDFVGDLQVALREAGADPRQLRLEITESLLSHDVEQMMAKISELAEMGISFALDNFGTGYSSLSHLKRLPLSQLKVDHTYAQEILADGDSAEITHAIIALGRSMGLEVLAAGVDTVAQFEFLAAQGCDFFQGDLFGKPGSAEEVLRGPGVAAQADPG